MTLLAIFIYILFSLLVFAFAIATGAMLFAARRLQPDRITGHIPDTLILLGCKIRTRSIESRIRTAADWMKDHPDTICICSGGQGKDEDISEAEYMKEGLTAQGIDWKRLPMERNSTNTRENLALSHRVIASLGRGDSGCLPRPQRGTALSGSSRPQSQEEFSLLLCAGGRRHLGHVVWFFVDKARIKLAKMRPRTAKDTTDRFIK